jgi:hypothetical protein
MPRNSFWMSIQIPGRRPPPSRRDLTGIQNFVVWFCDRPIIEAHGVLSPCHQPIIEVMKLDSRSGATLAAAAATLFLAGAVISTTSAPANAAQGKCMGANACKGQSACKGAANSCKGLNACKTNGFTMASEAKCTSMGGKFVKG